MPRDLGPPPPPSKVAPRLLAPLSTSTSTTSQPRLRWDMTGVTGKASIQLCRDRACQHPLPAATIDSTGTSAKPSAALPAGVVFWNVTAGGKISSTWELFVGHVAGSTVVDGSYGTILDVDGNGTPDVVAGGPDSPNSTHGPGSAALYMNGKAGLSAPPLLLPGPDGDSAQFGSSVVSGGDLNGDGYADLVIGDCDHVGASAVHIYFGGADGIAPASTSRTQVLNSPDGETGFGCRIAAAGDLNGDGYADLAIARIGADFSGGRLYIYYGSAKGLPATTTRIDSPNRVPSRLGYSLSGGGDINGDGYADLVASELEYSDLSGQVHIYWGGANGISNKQILSIASPDASGQQFGDSVSAGGDFDGDGYADFVVGSAASTGTMLPPLVHLYYGSSSGIATRTTTYDGSQLHEPAQFGIEVEVVGDVDGDGLSDVGISAQNTLALFLTGSLLDPAITVTGQGASVRSVSRTGDLDGDGYDDVLVGGSSSLTVVYGALQPSNPQLRTSSVTAPAGLFGFGQVLESSLQNARPSLEWTSLASRLN